MMKQKALFQKAIRIFARTGATAVCAVLICAALIWSQCFSVVLHAYNWTKYDLFVDGLVMFTDDVPLVDGDECLLPITYILGELGEYQATREDGQLDIKYGTFNINFRDGSRFIRYTDSLSPLRKYIASTKVLFTDGEVYVPADFFDDVLGFKTVINEEYGQVRFYVASKPFEEPIPENPEATIAPGTTPVPDSGATPDPAITPVPTAIPTVIPAITPTPTAIPDPSATPTVTPTVTPTPTPSPISTPVPTGNRYEDKALSTNFKYDNTGAIHYVLMDGISLTNGSEPINSKNYTESLSTDGYTYTITFADSSGLVPAATVNIDDDYLKTVAISRSGGTNAVITFTAKQKLAYLPITRQKSNQSAISIMPAKAQSDKLVMLDPGHGGSDPGATRDNIYESNINLAVSNKVKALLEADGIKVLCTREKDNYIGIYERAYMANLADASLFVSIHQNAHDSSAMRGTSVYYCTPSDATVFSGRKFASMIQTRLYKAIKTLNLGTIADDKNIVTKYTAMPAVIVETAFISNATEREQMQTEAFQNNAARAIYEGILEGLASVK